MCDVFFWIAIAVIVAMGIGIYWGYKKIQDYVN